MKSIRNHFLSRIIALIAGLAFLNMSFILAEVTFFDFGKSEVAKNIVKLLQNTGAEEERDGESSSESSAKESLAAQQVQIHSISSFVISIQLNRNLVNHYRHANHSLNFSPPPDSQLS